MKNEVRKKYVEIAENIKEKIISGEYREGEKIPSIRKLAATLKVNPQTVNKATSYLSSQGYLVPRQGAGSVVSFPVGGVGVKIVKHNILMLIDKARSRLITDPMEHAGYHCKDIYLSFLSRMGEKNMSASFLVYEKSAEAVSSEFVRYTEEYAGFIVQGGLPDCYFKFFQDNKIPFVMINRTPPSWFKGIYGSVMISLEKLTDAINYLVSMGHRRILYLFSSELEVTKTLSKRLDIIRRAAETWNYGVEIAEFDFIPDSEESEKMFSEYVEKGYTAAIAYNDVSALSIYPTVNKLGLKIPSDFSIIGFDDIFSGQIVDPPLTTIRVDRDRLVERSLSILFDIIGGFVEKPVIETVKTDLKFRKSASIAFSGKTVL